MQGHPTDLECQETKIRGDNFSCIPFFMDTFTIYPVLKSFLAGSFSGTFSTILFQPLDLVKTRLQSRVNVHIGPTKNGTLSIIAQIVRNERVFGLWRGMTPSITRVVPGVGLYFSSLHWLKHTLYLEEPLTSLQAVSLGLAARTMSGVLLIPITVVKTRFESGVYKYNSVGEALHLIYKYEGLRGLASGLIPTLLRDAPFSGLYLMFYTRLKRTVATDFPRSNGTATTHFGCGILAGILASVVTHPADVVKTKMQLYPSEFKRVSTAFVMVYKKYGLFGYFKGIVPRMLRRTLMSAMAWTVYEEITRNMGLK
ncbi:solute carrier family 25 member 38-B isoform X2 [Orussus abietinus]|uniref:solute carrier family 25 member 38-B isoform X2 n=1 Tax=Orussus abietinus TaxID=222816 RepID=UPI0006261082|nr:solute carrier family 25 member 38-B isoform X2 [Orussus abietinus]XP_012271573.1 solute carrier family 25 member 38-B isoform X2 [Orussus abietinus]XP_012271574.1 solute carrier family 25 member 38-B isoform X2 [Orussus abietinus]XP_012271575.1 solute carrier family 25 member 38-B isoform X2 [Orussus abietinus]XP_012271576.1 solute carrier family 25 member 38-B isoform X2 [Orussus abietinus]